MAVPGRARTDRAVPDRAAVEVGCDLSRITGRELKWKLDILALIRREAGQISQADLTAGLLRGTGKPAGGNGEAGLRWYVGRSADP